MKVVLLAPGAGSMYCGACARDASLAGALMGLGHEAVVIPLYTPIRLEAPSAAPARPVLFGGVNAYLREVLPGWDRWPAALRNALDRPGVLAGASRVAVKTRAADLGRMTCSVLEGPDGRHASEVARVAEAVAGEAPDAVIVSNSLLLGFVPALRRAGRFAVVCQVQGEDGFLDELPGPWRERAERAMRDHAREVDRFLAPSACHVAEMARRLEVPSDRFAVLPHPAPNFEPLLFPDGSPTIGHLSSIRRAKGLDTLLRAMAELPSEARLVVGGRVLEPPFHREVRSLARSLGERVRFLGEVPPAQKAAFFAGVDVVALPSRLRESRGVVGLESLAFGRPVVASAAGVYAEWSARSEGVAVVPEGDAKALADALRPMLERAEAARRGSEGRKMVRREFSREAVARDLARFLGELRDRRAPS